MRGDGRALPMGRIDRYPRDDSEPDRSSDVCSLHRVTQFKDQS